MAQQTINTGTTPADHTGDSVRSAFTKVNANFTELYEAAGNAASRDELDAHVEDTNNPHAVTKSQVGLPNVDNTSDANKPVSNATQTALNAKASTTALDAETTARTAADTTNASAIAAETAARIAADALKADLVGGVIPTAQIPAIAITAFLGSVSSQAAMLALSGQSGDWCNRSDTSTAWVIIGADPTQLSSWAQINYPASPVTSVNGQSGVIVLGKADVGLGSVDNTPDSGKPVSAAQQTALNAKQDKSSLGADSAAAVHAATSKTTPADNDEIGAADSAASFGLKKFTWANIKAALNGLYAALTHASRHKSGGVDVIKLDELGAPTDVTTLNATTSAHGLCPKFPGGTTNFLRADGTFAAPAGGGGALVRGYGRLQGNTSHGEPESPPPNVRMDFVSNNFATFSLYANGSYYYFTLSDTNPYDGTTWLDASSNSPPVMAGIFRDAINGLSIPGITASASNDGYDFLLVNNTVSGSGATLGMTTSEPGAYVISGGGSGTDATSDSGAIQEVVLIPQVGVKAVLPVKIAFYGDAALSGVTVEVSLKVGGVYYPVCANINGASSYGEVVPFSWFSEWIVPRISSTLVARYEDAPPFGGFLTFFAVAEQN